MIERRGDRVDDAELVALEAGIKPALRVSAQHGRVSEVAARYEGQGFVVSVGDVERFHGGQPCRHLYVAPSVDAAARLRATEEALIELSRDTRGGTRRQRRDLDRDLGLQLGYPACCVEAFGERLDVRTTEGLDQDERASRGPWGWLSGLLSWRVASPQYHHAVSAWASDPAPRLNVFRMGERVSLVSFEPCTFRCASALAIADATAGALGAKCSESMAHIDDVLARSVALAPAGERCEVELRRDPRCHVGAAVEIPLLADVPPGEMARSFREQIVGREVHDRGEIRRWPHRPAIVLDFGG